MAPSRADLERVVEEGEQEGGSVEFKEQLSKDTHLGEQDRRESLVAQLRYRVLSGEGEATYVVGVTDDGGITGLDSDAFSETLDVLSLIAEEADARIESVETWQTDEGGLVGMAEIASGSRIPHEENDGIVIGTAGHVDHGKSTLVGSLVTGDADDGAGDLRAHLDTRPHEVERGLSATLSHAVFGFDETGDVVRPSSLSRQSARAKVVEDSDRLVSFVDTVGHEPWLRTTIRGLIGKRLDYGLLTVSAEDGPTKTTREHLGILIATDLPTIVTITKTDLVDDERVETVTRTVERHLRDADVTPVRVSHTGVDRAVDEIGPDTALITTTSAVTRDGMDTLEELLCSLPSQHEPTGDDFTLYIDRVYDVRGVGAVASGAVKSGNIDAGDELLLGPFPDGRYEQVKAVSIELHHHRVDSASAGDIVGINLQGVEADEVERGMVLVPADASPPAVSEFEAEIMVLNHPTSIQSGYEPVIHVETVDEVARFESVDGGHLLPGDTGLVTARFKFHPHHLEEGQKFIFREGAAKGVGTITDINPD